jgi:sugar phosphate isomerase/epimerase
MADLLLHSVSYAGLWGQAYLTIDDFVAKAAELGFNGVMLMAKRPHVSILDYDAPHRAELRRTIEGAGLRRVCIAGYSNLTADLEHGEVPHREIQIAYIVELARLTHDLGGDLLRIYTGYENPAAGFTQQWNLIVDSLRECARKAKPLGVTLGVQNHHDIGVGYESMFDLIEAVNEPNCRAMFDAWAPALQGVDLAAAARRMAPVTAHTTVADYQLRPRYKYNAAVVNYEPLTPYVQAVPMGEGFIDYSTFFGELRQGGFDGSIAYEMCSPLLGGGSIDNLDRYARRFLEYMRGSAAIAADPRELGAVRIAAR